MQDEEYVIYPRVSPLQLPFTDCSNLFLAENARIRGLWMYREKNVISLIQLVRQHYAIMDRIFDLTEWLEICTTYTLALTITAQNSIDFIGR
jgi:hypothetical protein